MLPRYLSTLVARSVGLGGGEQLRGVVDELGVAPSRTRTPGGVRMLLRKDMLVLTPRMRISAMARSILRAVPSKVLSKVVILTRRLS